jgi:DNA polymerase III delta' subunit
VRAETEPSGGPRGHFRTRGHPLALAAVGRAIESGRPPQSLVIAGPAGIGKTTLALDLAAGLLCLSPEAVTRPCGSCAACRKVAHRNHPDLHRLAPEGAGEQIRLPQVLELASELALMPMEGRLRFALIESAHRLNPDAQNALLKTLEEPAGAACIVLCADDLGSILPTVASRSARLRLGPVPVDAITALLVEEEGMDAMRAHAVARAAAGSPGRALALARSPEALLVRARMVRQVADLLAADRRTRLGASTSLMADGAVLDAALRGALADGDPADDVPAGTAGRKPATRGRSNPAAGRSSARPEPAERRRAARQVMAIWRDVGRDLAVAAGHGRGRVRHLDILEELEAAAVSVPPAELLAFLDRLDGWSAALDAYASPELILDGVLLSWPLTSPAAA